MAKLDSAKEELGWLKVLFAVFVAMDASLMVALSAGAFWINRSAYRKIRELETL